MFKAFVVDLLNLDCRRMPPMLKLLSTIMSVLEQNLI